ncbi:MAG: glycerol-3-phosphate dehydrogenase/oxidase [Gammaproteobacteria bacterium]|nr:glycerol-3-phosphate dehydrogenase/oxidase [Gammaproteobacteria bacterium]
MRRQDLLDQLSRPAHRPWDVLVIGGGAVGLGSALDAVSRGYSTVLLEQHDFCKGTSSRSTKLIHGGVRYLRQGQLSLVREALQERARLLHNAPTIVKPLRFLIPCFSTRERLYYALGMKCYDALSGRLGIGGSRQLSTDQMRQAIPSLGSPTLRGGVAYHDAQFDDAQLALAIAQTFLARGGVPLNYVRVDALKQQQGKIAGVRAVNQETGQTYDISAKVVVNATGVFSDNIRRLEDSSAPAMISPSQGIHLVVERRFLGGDDALMIPKTKDGRVLFAIPWLGRLVLGTTDTPVDRATMEPTPLAQEVDYLLDHLADYLNPAPQRADICSVFAGLRPLVKPPRRSADTASISREHRILVSEGGLVSVLGGKWTTYRRMAEEVIDQAAHVADLPRQSSGTRELRLDDNTVTRSVDGLASPTFRPTRSDVRDAVTYQFARTVEDVLARRHRCLLLDAAESIGYAREVAQVIAEQLNRDPSWIETQVRAYSQLAASYALKSVS